MKQIRYTRAIQKWIRQKEHVREGDDREVGVLDEEHDPAERHGPATGRYGHNNQLSRHLTELRLENRLLMDKYIGLAQELQDAFETIEDLQGTKYALDSKERQANKLGEH